MSRYSAYIYEVETLTATIDDVASLTANLSSLEEVAGDISIPHFVYQDHGIPSGGTIGQLLVKNSNEDYDATWVSPATSVIPDNTLPITSGAVYTEVGNINALLATI